MRSSTDPKTADRDRATAWRFSPPPELGEGADGRDTSGGHASRGRRTVRRPASTLRKRLAILPLVLLPLLAACEKEKRFEPPDRAARVAQADSLYSPALFDTVAWASAEARMLEGNRVFAEECRRCHGTLGEGDTPYAREQGLDVPSLVEPEWEYAGDVEAVRHRVFIGHEAGMPTWGVAGITPREIDAAAAYVVEQLRPEVLGTEDAGAAGGEDATEGETTP